MSAHAYEREGREGLEESVGQGARVSIYHLLCAAFSQGIAITQVIDLDVLDVVTVLLVDLDIESTTIGRSSGGRLCRARHDAGRVGLGGKVSFAAWESFFFSLGLRPSYCTNGRDVDMLRGLLLAELGIDTCCSLGRCSCRVPLWPSRLDALSDGTATTSGALTVALGRRARAAVKLATARRVRLGLVEARAFARFVAHVGVVMRWWWRWRWRGLLGVHWRESSASCKSRVGLMVD